MPTLGVAIYNPPEGPVKHWAFCINSTPPVIAEVLDGNPNFKLSIRENVDPERTNRYIKTIEVCELDSQRDVDEALEIIEAQDIRNTVTEWMCQDFILECLESMYDANLISDYDYHEAKEELDGIYNE